MKCLIIKKIKFMNKKINCNDLFMGFFVVFIVFLGSLFIKNINIFLILDLLEYKNVW